jgi:hypothetical protein
VSSGGSPSVFVDDAAEDWVAAGRGVERHDEVRDVVGQALLASLVRPVITDMPNVLVKDRPGG